MGAKLLRGTGVPGEPLLLPSSSRCSSKNLRRKRKNVARAQKVEEASQRRGAAAVPGETKRKASESYFPKFEDGKADEDFLPKRQPGSFPDTHVTTNWQAAVNKLQSLTATPEPSTSEGEKEYDPLRDGPLRYLGYANECGEAFAAWLPFWGVPFSYAVAISYVLTDTADKGSKAYKTSKTELSANQELHPEVNVPRLVQLLAFERALDTVVWQLLASVACPGYTIHTIVALVHGAIKPLEETAAAQQLAASAASSLHVPAADVLTILDKSFPTAMGLAAIPFIVHPIDNGIHALMNLTLRPAMRKYVCGQGQGSLAELQMCSCGDCLPTESTSASAGNNSQDGSS